MIATAPIRGRRGTRTGTFRESGRAGTNVRTSPELDRPNRFADIIESFRDGSREGDAVKELERRRTLSGE